MTFEEKDDEPAQPKTRAEALQERYRKTNQEQKREWDPVFERWVAVEDLAPKQHGATIVGISLDGPLNTAGKTEDVANAMRERQDKMKAAQAKAKADLLARRRKEQEEEEEEMQLRQRLDPALKAWSEEYGKKKNIRALLAGLDSVMYEDSGWNKVSMADLLQPSQVRRVHRRANMKVHPDRVGRLSHEKRFIAKRIFDALTQAYSEFENSGQA